MAREVKLQDKKIESSINGMEETSGTMEFGDNFNVGNESTVKSEPDDDEDIDINNLLKESEDFLPSRFMEVFVNDSSSGLIDPELPLEKSDTQATNEVGPILTPFSLNFADDMNVSYEGERDGIYEEEKKGVCCVCGREEGDDRDDKNDRTSIKFHEFPTDQALFRRWKEVCHMRRSSSSLPVHQWRVCSKHFTFKDYVYRCGKTTLNSKAIPSVDMPKTPWRVTSPSPEPSERFCCVCRETDRGNSPVTFHPFPSEKNVFNLWKEKCGMSNASEATRNNWFVCSNHFITSNFRYHKGVWRLLPTAVPSKNFPKSQSRGTQQGTREIRTCSICHFKESAYSAVSFHPFPVLQSMINVWKEKCGVDKVGASGKPLFVCSRHFSISDYTVEDGKRQLVPLAVPSIGLKPYMVSQESQELMICFLCKRQGTGGKYSVVSYHKFPSDRDSCLIWKKLCNLSVDDDVSRLRICSRHFSHLDQYFSDEGVRTVRSGAIPCFNIPNVGSNPGSVTPKPFPNNAAPKRLYVLSNVAQSQLSQSTVVNNMSSSLANQNTSKNIIVSSTLNPNKSVPTPASVGNSAATLPVPELSGGAPNQRSNLSVPNSKFLMMKDGTTVQRAANGKTVFLSLNTNKSSSAPVTVGSSIVPQYRLIYPKPPNIGMRPTIQLAVPYQLASTGSLSQNATIRPVSRMTASATPVPAHALNSMLQTATGASVVEPTKTEPPTFEASSTSLGADIKPISLKFQGGPVSKEAVSVSSNRRPLSTEELLRTVRQPVVLLERLAISKDGKVVIPPKQKQQRGRYPKNKKQFKKYIKDLKLDWKQKRSGFIGQSYGAKISPKDSGDSLVKVEDKPGEDQSGDTRGREMDEIPKSGTETEEEDSTGRCYLCNWDGRRGDGNPVALYRFPSMPGVCYKWKRICNVKDGDDVSALRICSKHFRPEAFVQTKGSKQRGELSLTLWAYPCLTVPNTKALAEIDKEYAPNMEAVVESPKRVCFLCSYREGQDKTNKTTLYRFPCRGNAAYQWKQACNVYDHDYMDTSSLFVCANHFTESDFANVGDKILKLKPGAVPSVNVPNMPKASGNVVSAQSSVDSCDISEEGFDPADLVEVTLNESESPVALRPSDKSLSPLPSGTPTSTPQVYMSSEQVGESKKTVFVKRYFFKSQNQNRKLATDRTLAPYTPLRSDNDKGAVNQSVSNSPLNTRLFDDRSSALSSSTVVCRIAQTPGAVTVSSGNLPQYQIVSPAEPPMLYIPTPPAKNVAHTGCQTLATAILADKMCQTVTTAVFSSSADASDERRETMFQPPAKKRRVSSPVETGLSVSGRDTQPAENTGEKESDVVKKRLKSVQDLVIHLQQKSMLSQEASDMIMSTLTDEIQELIASKLQSDGQGKLSADLRSFALTLHFFSTVAYNYVRNIWPNLLPDPSLIRNWFSVSDGKPGFTQEVLDDIYSKSKENGGSFPCCVFVCDLPIRREVFFEDGQFYGNVNLGTDQDMRQDGAFTAQTALVFFVSALHKTWCCPLGYFFISSLNAWERANVLTKCLDLLHEVYANVVSITIDGSPVNVSMCNCLGANFVYGKDWRPWFLDPVTQKKVLVFWDTLKMLRLVRDALGDMGCIFTQDDKIIKWSALKWLVKFQSEVHLKVFTHLTKKHVEYQSDRSNALLCRQVFSQNVCKAFRFARELQIPELRSAKATDKFCMVFCHLFNMVSSENVFSRRECGSCVTELTRHFMLKSAESFVKYISSLKDATDVPILKSSRKTGFLGLVINLINSLELFDVLSKVGVKQLLTAKLSHEYVELFSATIQREVNDRLPNTKQFQDAYRKFVLKRAVRKIRLGPSTCLVDSIEMLHTISSMHKYPARDFSDPISVGIFDSTFVSIVRMLNPLLGVEKYLYGFVVKKIISSGLCSSCACHLTTERNVTKILTSDVSCAFVEPSSSVMRICRRTDSVFRELRTSILFGRCTKEMFVNEVFMCVCWDVFISSKMDEHILEQGYLDNHRSQLCKLVIETLFDIRVFCEKEKEGKRR